MAAPDAERRRLAAGHLAYLSEKHLIMDQGDEGITITKGGREIYDKLRDAIGGLL